MRVVHSWLSSLLKGFFFGFSGFPPSVKINIYKIQFDLETVKSVSPSLFAHECVGKSQHAIGSISAALSSPVFVGSFS